MNSFCWTSGMETRLCLEAMGCRFVSVFHS
jgi:hypothetical protein